jgi:hypothetical protein
MLRATPRLGCEDESRIERTTAGVEVGQAEIPGGLGGGEVRLSDGHPRAARLEFHRRRAPDATYKIPASAPNLPEEGTLKSRIGHDDWLTPMRQDLSERPKEPGLHFSVSECSLGMNLFVDGQCPPPDGNCGHQSVKVIGHLRPVEQDDRPSTIADDIRSDVAEVQARLAHHLPVGQKAIDAFDVVLRAAGLAKRTADGREAESSPLNNAANHRHYGREPLEMNFGATNLQDSI